MPRRTSTAAAIAALALALAGCQSTAGGSSSASGGSASGGSGGADAPTTASNGQAGLHDYTCEGKFVPAPSGITTGASIKATVWNKCPAHPPREHHITISVERDHNGHWIPQAERTFDDIPATDLTIRLVTTPCVPGLWRVHTEVWGIAESGKPFASSTSPIENVSEPKQVNPHDCG